MVFSSITFLIYFLPISIVGYFLLSFSRGAQNIWLLAVSLLFFAWGEPVFVFLMIGSIIANWLFGMLIQKYEDNAKNKKLILIVSIVVNLSMLGIFKYTNFFIDTIYDAIGWKKLLEVPTIALPIGISFFTFQAVSYVIDVYRKDAEVQRNPFYLGLYLAFFPQLLAGPMVRYSTIVDKILNRKTSPQMFLEGCTRFALGLVKKVIIANNMAIIADNIYLLVSSESDAVKVPVILAWIGAIAYTIQIYYDFSSYADMAIGLGRIFGLQFEENFDYPFISKSVSEFMSRFNISLGKWFNHYVYRPLGGSQVVNKDIMVRNLFIVWLLTGIWYGANWTFIWWGLFVFSLILVEKTIMLEKWEGHPLGRRIYTLVAIVIAMVIFRSEDMHQCSKMLLNMVGINGNGFFSATAIMFIKEYWLFFVAAIVCMIPHKMCFKRLVGERKVPVIVKALGSIVYIAGLSALLLYSAVVLSRDANLAINNSWNEAYVKIYNALGKNEMDGFTYVRDKNGKLYQGDFYSTSKLPPKEYVLRIKRLQMAAAEKGSKVVVLLYPTQYNEKWSNGYYGMPYSDNNAIIEEFASYLRYFDIDHIDYTQTFLDRDMKVTDVFYKTDHNWRVEVAFDGFGQMVNYLNEKFDAKLDTYYTDINNYNVETYENSFVGSQGREAGVYYVGLDDFTFITPKFETDYLYRFERENGEEQELTGPMEGTLITKSYLDEEDYYKKDMYSSYLGGICLTDYIENKMNKDGLKVLFLRDSYSSPLATFFSSYCSNVDMMWAAKTEAETIENAVEENNYDYIFVGLAVDSYILEDVKYYQSEEGANE